jgi:hypothetical protein
MHQETGGCYLQAMVFKMQHVHREMFSTLYGSKPWLVRTTAPKEVPVNPQKLLEQWDYEGSLTAPVCTSARQLLFIKPLHWWIAIGPLLH